MARIMARDTPLAEITLRKYERPYQLSKRDLVKKMCLSLGLLQPGDSRDSIIDVLYVLLEAKNPLGADIITAKARKNREEHNVDTSGCSFPNVRRSIKRLKEILLIEKQDSGYRLSEGSSFSEIISENIESYAVQSILKRVKDYAGQIDEKFSLKRNP